MVTERIVWRTAQPLWASEPSPGAPRAAAPAVLRFAGDDFMEQLHGAVEGAGGGLAPLVAGRETWQDEGAGLGSDHEAAPNDPITLFQPTHGRFYLVAASLVCRRYGHPDRAIDTGDDEAVSFVLRRLDPVGALADPDDPDSFGEWAWTGDAWVPAADHHLALGEEQLPLFGVPTRCQRGPRRLHVGLLPASRREQLAAAPETLRSDEVVGSEDPAAPLADLRLAALEPLVAGLLGLRGLRATAPSDAVGWARESFYYLLVDLADWLVGHLGDPDAAPSQQLPPATGALAWLATPASQLPGTPSQRAALQAARAQQDAALEGDPPVVAGMSASALSAAAEELLFLDEEETDVEDPTGAPLFLALQAALQARDAVAVTGVGPVVTTTLAATAPAAPAGEPMYAVRCVYSRPHCRPAERQLLSPLSRPFRFAAFHEPDAPGRPVRIPLPVDTSPAGLRRFPKNVSVVLSTELRKQMQLVSEETLQDGSLNAPRPVDFGLLCQLSIPIITICALILLMIIVQLLNIVFFWVPLFKVCLPVKKGG